MLVRPAALLTLLVLSCARIATATDCSGASYSSTFALIQDVIFAKHGCTDQLCHGDARSGGLDLRPEVAHQNLIDMAATSVDGFLRVVPGQKDRSLLWINLAAKTDPAQWHAPLRPMPLDPLPALSANELELVRLWIEKGAPKEGTVPGSADLVDACLPPPQPLTIHPLPPPINGVQFRIPTTTVRAHSEHEVCFAQYFDITDKVPVEYRSPDGTKLRYKRTETRQTPISHHLVMSIYRGAAPLDSPEWGEFVCWGGAHDGERCDQFAPDPCGDGVPCATRPVRAIGCIGFGPGDAGFGANGMGDNGAGQTSVEIKFADGVYDELPLKGLIVWNSHAFNLTDVDSSLDAWLNFDFTPPDQQVHPVQRITNGDQIFKMNVPPFQTEEVCHTQVMEPAAHLFLMTSHTHRHGKRFRVFRGAFTCQGGPHAGEACSPFGPDFVSPDLCAGARCAALETPHAGDCDYDGEVSVDEMVRGVNIALGAAKLDACVDADVDEDGQVMVNEVMTAVNACLGGMPPPAERDPQASLLYVSLLYDDPFTERFEPPLIFAPAASPDTARTLTFCSLYDNGYTDPSEVKTRANSPRPPVAIGFGGPCRTPTNCTQGRVTEPCRGGNDRTRNASCDTTPGAGDGVCDACPAVGGVTTEDEMFILLGEYYVP